MIRDQRIKIDLKAKIDSLLSKPVANRVECDRPDPLAKFARLIRFLKAFDRLHDFQKHILTDVLSARANSTLATDRKNERLLDESELFPIRMLQIAESR